MWRRRRHFRNALVRFNDSLASSFVEVGRADRQPRRGLVRPDLDRALRVANEAEPDLPAWLLLRVPGSGQPPEVQLVRTDVHGPAARRECQ